MNLRKGSIVWVQDRELAWVPAQVLDSATAGNQVHLSTASGKKVLALREKLFPRDADEDEHGGVEDMTKLTYLNEPGVLYNLRRRYALNDIYVPSFFIRKLVKQVFSFINITLFNSLLLRRECCTFSNGKYVKSGLTELEKWIVNANEKYAGTSWHELNYIRQAVGFLVIHLKRKKSLEEIRQDLCPVVNEMREILSKDNQNLPSNSFLLDDDLSIPFSTEDIVMAISAIDTDDIDLPAFLYGNPTQSEMQVSLHMDRNLGFSSDLLVSSLGALQFLPK